MTEKPLSVVLVHRDAKGVYFARLSDRRIETLDWDGMADALSRAGLSPRSIESAASQVTFAELVDKPDCTYGRA